MLVFFNISSVGIRHHIFVPGKVGKRRAGENNAKQVSGAIDWQIQYELDEEKHVLLQYILDSSSRDQQSLGDFRQNTQRFSQFNVKTREGKEANQKIVPGSANAGTEAAEPQVLKEKLKY